MWRFSRIGQRRHKTPRIGIGWKSTGQEIRGRAIRVRVLIPLREPQAETRETITSGWNSR